MAIEVTWYDEAQTVMLWTYTGQWTWHDYENARTQSRSLVGQSKNPIYVIADFRASRLLPNNALSNFRNSYDSADYEFILAVIVAKSLWFESMIGALRRLYPQLGKKVQLAHSLDDAITLIHRHQAEQKTAASQT